MTSDETPKTDNDGKRPSEKRKSSLLSLVLSFCLTDALALLFLSFLLGYSFADIIDMFGLPRSPSTLRLAAAYS